MVVVPSNNDNDKEERGSRIDPNSSLLYIAKEELKNRVASYTDDLVLREIVQKLPDIGFPLDIMLAYIGQKIGEQRIAECFKILHEELNPIVKVNKFDEEFYLTAEFLDLFLKAFENSLKTRHRERIMLNCKILVGALNKDKKEDRHYAEDFLYAVANLTPTDILVAREIYKLQKNRPDHFDPESKDTGNELQYVVKSGYDKLQEICKLDQIDFDVAVHKLSAVALVKEVGPGYIGYTGGRYIITPFFLKLMNFIQLRANDPLFDSNVRDPEPYYLTPEEANDLIQGLKDLQEGKYETFESVDDLMKSIKSSSD